MRANYCVHSQNSYSWCLSSHSARLSSWPGAAASCLLLPPRLLEALAASSCKSQKALPKRKRTASEEISNDNEEEEEDAALASPSSDPPAVSSPQPSTGDLLKVYRSALSACHAKPYYKGKECARICSLRCAFSDIFPTGLCPPCSPFSYTAMLMMSRDQPGAGTEEPHLADGAEQENAE